MVIIMAKLSMAHASTHGARIAHASRLGQNLGKLCHTTTGLSQTTIKASMSECGKISVKKPSIPPPNLEQIIIIKMAVSGISIDQM